MSNDIRSFLPPAIRDLEWYDNSTLSVLDRCYRKGFWKNVFTLPQTPLPATAPGLQDGILFKGISERVGPAALYGTAIHSALDKRYSPSFASLTYEQKRILALRTFTKKYNELIPDPEIVENKHSLDRGLDILDLYFDRYEEEDKWFRVVETEVVFINVVRPRPGEEPFNPFIYIARSDGLIERLQYDDYFILEHKNVVAVDLELIKLKIGRQGEGYIWSAKEFPTDKPINGMLANILAVRAAEVDPLKLFKREYIHKTSYQTEQWRIETIKKVQRWRLMLQKATEQPNIVAAMLEFDRTTEECTRYGKCSFYDLCIDGPLSIDLEKYSPNTWNPLYTEKVGDE